MASVHIHKEGFLVKAPMSIGLAARRSSAEDGGFVFGTWLTHKKSHRRFFVLDGVTLSYFERSGDLKPKGTIELRRESIIKTMEDDTGLLVIPYPGSKRELYMVACSKDERDAWVEAISHVCNWIPDEELEEKHSDAGDVLEEGENLEEVQEEAHQLSRRASTSVSSISSSGRKSSGSETWREEWERRVRPHTRIPKLEHNIVKEGYMEKLSSSIEDHWNNRYFVLDQGLKYFETKESFEEGERGIEICLQAFVISRAEEPSCLLVYAVGATYKLRCETEEERNDWIDKMENRHHYLYVVNRRARVTNPTAVKVVPEFLKHLQTAAPPSPLVEGSNESKKDVQLPAPPSSPPTVPTQNGESSDKFSRLKEIRGKRKQQS